MNEIEKLKEHYALLNSFEHLRAIAGWDQATMMPSGGAEARSEAMSALAVHIHKLLSDPRILDWIEGATSAKLSNEESVFLREAKRSYLVANQLPTRLVKAKAKAGAKCEHAWRGQKSENNWQGFLKNFEEVVALSQEEAQIRSDGKATPYDALMDLYEPGMTSNIVDSVFHDVESWLPNLISHVIDRQNSEYDRSADANSVYPIELQEKMGKALMAQFGFDFERGRLDVSAHPFCGGVSDDTRITTRYDEANFIPAMMGVIHETGHARYEQMLPKANSMFPVGKARSMGIHESQSLFFEMQIARDKAFIPHLFSQVQRYLGKTLPVGYSLDKFSQTIQKVERGFIRVDADEVTYPAHVILRYQIEKALINKEIKTTDIPELWDEKMRQYLGLSTAGNYREGCMQDIHWTDGSFGYFPSYTLGAMYAAQFRAAMGTSFSVEDCLAKNELHNIQSWLNANIWSKGCSLTTVELIEQATGSGLDASHFRRHLETRYL